MKLIDKAAIVAEIERRIEENKADIQRATHKRLKEYFEGYEDALVLFKERFLNTLEVKEVDLDFKRFAKEMEIVFALPSSKTKNTEEEPLNWEYAIAKHFFELGLKVKQESNDEVKIGETQIYLEDDGGEPPYDGRQLGQAFAYYISSS